MSGHLFHFHPSTTVSNTLLPSSVCNLMTLIVFAHEARLVSSSSLIPVKMRRGEWLRVTTLGSYLCQSLSTGHYETRLPYSCDDVYSTLIWQLNRWNPGIWLSCHWKTGGNLTLDTRGCLCHVIWPQHPNHCLTISYTISYTTSYNSIQ